VDLLDRALDKGVVIQADLIVSLAGVPLIGVCLRAALAGMETMLNYGIMTDWDSKTRLSKSGLSNRASVQLLDEEQPIYRGLGACHFERGLYKTWQYGHVYVTNRRLLLHQEIFDKLLVEVPLEEIRLVEGRDGEDAPGRELTLELREGGARRLRATDPGAVLNALKKAMAQQGLMNLSS
jgi:hypothetical protein